MLTPIVAVVIIPHVKTRLVGTHPTNYFSNKQRTKAGEGFVDSRNVNVYNNIIQVEDSIDIEG